MRSDTEDASASRRDDADGLAAAVEPAAPAYSVSSEAGAFLVASPDGGELSFELRLAATHDGRAWSHRPAEWSRSDYGWVEVVPMDTARWRLSIDADPARPVLVLRTRITYATRVEVAHEEVALHIAGAPAATVLARDMAPRAVESGERYLTDPWTPLEATVQTPIGPITVVRRRGFPSAITERAGENVIVRLEIDDEGDHPYDAYEECFERYSAEHEERRERLHGTPRSPGDEVEHVAEIWIGESAPLRVQRLPAGRRAALVFTSHADQSRTLTTRALLWGHSDPEHPTFGRRGMLPRALVLTLSAFARDGWNADMTDPEFVSILQAAAAAGVEVCPHSVTARPDNRQTVRDLLPSYAPFSPATWIDHQPDTNCEAINNSSGLPGRNADYRIIDLLLDAGYRYFWNEPDARPPSAGLNLFAPARPAYRPAILFRNAHLGDRGRVPWMFKTMWMFTKTDDFLAAYADARLERLIRERGIHLAHVYLDTYQSSGRLAAKPLVEPDAEGFRIRDDVDAMFERLGATQAAGDLWVTSMRDLGDHLEGLSAIDLDCRPDGTTVVHAAPRPLGAVTIPLGGVTIAAPVAGVDVAVDGSNPSGVIEQNGEVLFWFDLPAGESRTISVVRDGATVRCLREGSTVPRP